MKSMQVRNAAVAAVILALAGCGTMTPTQTATVASSGQTALVDGAVCAGDAAAINGKTLIVAKGVATDANCAAALGALIAAGTAVSAVVTVPVPAAAVTP